MAKEFTIEEVAQRLIDLRNRKIQQFEAEIVKLRKREELSARLHPELKKSLVPPHRHNVGASVGSGVEDVPASKLAGKAEKAEKSPESTPPSEETPGEESPGECPACGGALKELGSLGNRKHSRCTACGMDSSKMAKEELCKECGKSHFGKACKADKCASCNCDPCKCMGKSALSDKIQEAADEHTKEKEIKTDPKKVAAPGSGGQIKRGPKVMKKSAELKNNLKKSTAEMIEASKGSDLKKFQDGIKKVALLRLEVEELEKNSKQKKPCAICGEWYQHLYARPDGTFVHAECAEKEKKDTDVKKNAILGYGGSMGAPDAGAMGMPGATMKRENSVHAVRVKLPTEKAEPPMAKPPSGVNMATKVPTSAPKPPPGPKMGKDELEKGVMADIARQNSPPVPAAAAPGPKTKLPTPEEHAQRAATHQAALGGAFTPKGPVVSGMQIQTRRPGIFGKIGNK